MKTCTLSVNLLTVIPSSLYSNTTADNNTAVGNQALERLTSASYNCALGQDALEKVKRLGLEDVIGITGVVVARPDDAKNVDMFTGEIDVEVKLLEVYNESAPSPFDINDRNSFDRIKSEIIG